MAKSILLIDDDALVLQSLARLLEKSGYVVKAVKSAKEAIDASLMEEFDLVITDIRMPEVDGIQALRYLREVRRDKGQAQAPEILITGYAKEYEEPAKHIGAYAMVHKPFQLEEFLGVVKKALE